MSTITSKIAPRTQRTSFACPGWKCIPRTIPRREREWLSWTKRLVDAEFGEHAAAVGLEEEAALVAVDDRREQQGSVELGQELLHLPEVPGLTISPPPQSTRSDAAGP